MEFDLESTEQVVACMNTALENVSRVMTYASRACSMALRVAQGEEAPQSHLFYGSQRKNEQRTNTIVAPVEFRRRSHTVKAPVRSMSKGKLQPKSQFLSPSPQAPATRPGREKEHSAYATSQKSPKVSSRGQPNSGRMMVSSRSAPPGSSRGFTGGGGTSVPVWERLNGMAPRRLTGMDKKRQEMEALRVVNEIEGCTFKPNTSMVHTPNSTRRKSPSARRPVSPTARHGASPLQKPTGFTNAPTHPSRNTDFYERLYNDAYLKEMRRAEKEREEKERVKRAANRAERPKSPMHRSAPAVPPSVWSRLHTDDLKQKNSSGDYQRLIHGDRWKEVENQRKSLEAQKRVYLGLDAGREAKDEPVGFQRRKSPPSAVAVVRRKLALPTAQHFQGSGDSFGRTEGPKYRNAVNRYYDDSDDDNNLAAYRAEQHARNQQFLEQQRRLRESRVKAVESEGVFDDNDLSMTGVHD